LRKHQNNGDIMTSILISTWGDPHYWADVTYSIHGKKYPKPTKSSLPIILKHIQPAPEKVLLIVLDTVVKRPASSYEDVRNFVKEYYRNFLHSLEIEIPVEIIVAPGAGTFKLNNEWYAEFQGSLTDFAAYVTFEVARHILQTKDKELTVHLDLTHGVNFMPSLTYASSCQLLETIAISRTIYLKVYNAEPYIRGVTTKLNIHIVESRKVTPSIKCQALSHGRLLKQTKPEKKLESVRLQLKDVYELNAFLSSLHNGLPLVYFTFYPDVDNLGSLLKKAEEIWSLGIDVHQMTSTIVSDKISESKKMLVQRKLNFDEEFIKCVIIWAIAKALDYSRKNEVKLSELKSMKQKVFGKWLKLSSMIGYDLDGLKKDLSLVSSRWIKLSQLDEKYRPPRTKETLIRNFLAHSGLEKSMVFAKREHNQIMLCYDPKARETIFKACLKGLARG